MPMPTLRPSLLVKMTAPPARATLALQGQRLDLRSKPLFASIGKTSAIAAAHTPEWHILSASELDEPVNPWDLCHQLVAGQLGMAGAPAPVFAEPDLEQRWMFAPEGDLALTMTATCDAPEESDSCCPSGGEPCWFRDASHSQLGNACALVGEPDGDRTRVAHLDTGYDPDHCTLPKHLRWDLQRNFVDEGRPRDAAERGEGRQAPEINAFRSPGHGTGTLGILAGRDFAGVPLGGAAFLEVVPVRVANWVVLFKNSAIAQALDYVHGLHEDPKTRVHVVTMSMGGLASMAWADAVNALYDLGVVVVTAAGNNYGNLPTRNIVYPARFKRVIAACGVMADGRPYADLGLGIMAGNYGPASKMDTAMAAYTPNTPWAKFGCGEIVDLDGRGTSSATPQIAAAAALWIQKHKKNWEAYPEGWMRVEAVRKGLFESAASQVALRDRLGRGVLRAEAALSVAPASEAILRKQAEDVASFPFLRVITGLGEVVAEPSRRQRMLELEALQLSQTSADIERLLPDPDAPPRDMTSGDKRRLREAFMEAPGASMTLKSAIGAAMGEARPATPRPDPGDDRLAPSASPRLQEPLARDLRVYAFDPIACSQLATLRISRTTLKTYWENDLRPGPTGEYLEVVDIDPASGCCYPPVDLNEPSILAQDGVEPSEADPFFHQQMAYACAMKTIEHFEHALGRKALWAPRRVRKTGANGKEKYEERFVRRLRIYPHAFRDANAFYSPEKKALLFGYFQASKTDPGDNLPGGAIFTCLSHDVVAHETTHALLDGLHRRYVEPTNPDCLAFHEAFADIVALFQHFAMPDALRDQIGKTRGDLGQENLLGELAVQFGHGIGLHEALRSAIGGLDDETKKYSSRIPSPADYQQETEPHKRGAVLVAAVFDAFLQIYRYRSQDLLRLATGGTGILPLGEIPYDLLGRLTEEASTAARHVLTICIRALDYCPPVDVTFGEYLRALITADRDLVQDDDLSYRVAFISAFRRRGIFPDGVRSLSQEELCWDPPVCQPKGLDDVIKKMDLAWSLRSDRQAAFKAARCNASIMHKKWLSEITSVELQAFGLHTPGKILTISLPGNGAGGSMNVQGALSPLEVHSVRPARRIGPDGQQRIDLVTEITQRWVPENGDGRKYRGGCALIIDLETNHIRYCVSKRVGHAGRISNQMRFVAERAKSSLRGVYFDDQARVREPFALTHRIDT